MEQRSTYGEAANNLALVLAARGETDKAIDVLHRLLQANPGFEMGYVTLCRIYLKAGQRQKGTQALEQLLQRNPTHPLGLQLLQGIRPEDDAGMGPVRPALALLLGLAALALCLCRTGTNRPPPPPSCDVRRSSC